MTYIHNNLPCLLKRIWESIGSWRRKNRRQNISGPFIRRTSDQWSPRVSSVCSYATCDDVTAVKTAVWHVQSRRLWEASGCWLSDGSLTSGVKWTDCAYPRLFACPQFLYQTWCLQRDREICCNRIEYGISSVAITPDAVCWVAVPHTGQRRTQCDVSTETHPVWMRRRGRGIIWHRIP